MLPTRDPEEQVLLLDPRLHLEWLVCYFVGQATLTTLCVTSCIQHRKASAVVMNLEDVEEEEEIASGSLAKTTAPVYHLEL